VQQWREAETTAVFQQCHTLLNIDVPEHSMQHIICMQRAWFTGLDLSTDGGIICFLQ